MGSLSAKLCRPAKENLAAIWSEERAPGAISSIEQRAACRLWFVFGGGGGGRGLRDLSQDALGSVGRSCWVSQGPHNSCMKSAL